MTDQQHPIVPPRDKIHNWLQLEKIDYNLEQIITLAAQWGADQELEACMEWISKQDWTWTSAQFRAARRPKPPSLKEEALMALDRMNQFPTADDQYIIRRALEALDD